MRYLFMLLLLSMSALAQIDTLEEKEHYLQLLGKDLYVIEGDGKFLQECTQCHMEMQVCHRSDNINNILSVEGYDENYRSIDIDAYVQDLRASYIMSQIQPNGTREDIIIPSSFLDITQRLDAAPIDTCLDVLLDFTVDKKVDIVPVFNDIIYEEYAWFQPFQQYDGSVLYMPFDQNISTGIINNVGAYTYNCTIGGTSANIPYKNDVSGIYVNDSATYIYGRNDWKDDFCTMPNIGDELDIYANRSWYISSWFTMDSIAGDRFIFRGTGALGGGSQFVELRSKSGADVDNICLQLRNNLGGNEISSCLTPSVNDSLFHHVVFTHNEATDRLEGYLDNVLYVNISNTGWDIFLDDIEIGGLSSLVRDWDGQIDELYLNPDAYANTDIVERLYHVSSYSSLLQGALSFSEEILNISTGVLYNITFNVTDAFDNVTFATNDSLFSSINATGFFTTNSSNATTRVIYVNVTDGFGNLIDDVVVINYGALVAPVEILYFNESIGQINITQYTNRSVRLNITANVTYDVTVDNLNVSSFVFNDTFDFVDIFLNASTLGTFSLNVSLNSTSVQNSTTFLFRVEAIPVINTTNGTITNVMVDVDLSRPTHVLMLMFLLAVIVVTSLSKSMALQMGAAVFSFLYCVYAYGQFGQRIDIFLGILALFWLGYVFFENN